MPVVLKLGYRNDGEEDKLFDKYVIYYNPEIKKGMFTLTVTEDVEMAKKFDNGRDALEYGRQICPNIPTRLDGGNNRPLCAWDQIVEEVRETEDA